MRTLFSLALALGAMILGPGPRAQAAPMPITQCQTISASGSYVLANNLGPSGLTSGLNCLEITADFVTVDLAGFSITGRDAGSGIVAFRQNFGLLQGIAVRNGSISHFSIGVDLESAETSIVEGLRVANNNLDGIRAQGIVRGNTAANNFNIGILATGTVINNYAIGNSSGIVANVSGQLGTTIIGNTAVKNTFGGIIGFGGASPGMTIVANTAVQNSSVGIRPDCPSNVTDNTAILNGQNIMPNGADCHLEDNVAP
jgi:hypothetical protein